MTDVTPPLGTIDITDTVESLRSAWVDWGVAYVFGLEVAIPGMEFVALPVIVDVDKFLIHGVLTAISKAEVSLAFFMETAVRKASQAQDLISAVKAKNSMPATSSDVELAAAEQKQMIEFRNFVLVTN